MLDGLLVARVDPGFLDQAVVAVNCPDLDNSFRRSRDLVLDGAPARDEVLVGVHDLGVDVEPRVLLLGPYHVLTVHVVKQEVALFV